MHSEEDARAYVECFKRAVLVQEYIPGPEEAGIFYYRMPGERRGHIFSVTRKVFPRVLGDGIQTLEQLIRADARASIVASVYLKRFAGQKDRVPEAGESVRLVEAGNHCQGAIFLEGSDLITPKLLDRIDQISGSVNGFFVGRYDLRYESDEALRDGGSFKIIELNGASSEASNIYDPQKSLWAAYRILFRQWEIIFEIADLNRRSGLQPARWRAIWTDWINYRRNAAALPVSD
jgi:hypothetical protein